ncbi:hypothetical protein PHYPSEUDO_000815 [Phytophthora pseudosyringae]|uniref:BZIP domain-containing protein n=1 Tax=Phytophthora pseudosyringae TaxID=221518 RepID=A0A8T1WF83_9STRA|nr:hypothetical protein PHYPSEUDO_000815 [Phytophthora pseudosyringae]
MATFNRRFDLKGGAGLLPPLLPPKQPANDGQRDATSPRRLAPLFTRKRETPRPMDAQSELLSVLVPLTKLIADSKAATSPPIAEAAPTALSPPEAKPKRKKRIRPKTERRRQQCRNNQAQYRERQRGYIREIEESVGDLQREIQELNKERHTLCYGIQTKNNPWNVVVEYFRLFRYGFLVSMCEIELSGVLPTTDLNDQEYFLRAVMASEVAFGELSGVDLLIDQWRLYSSCFGHLHLQLNRMEQHPLGAMVASATLSLTITEATLRYVFPHLLVQAKAGADNDEDNGGQAVINSPLCYQLLGQRLDCRCSVRFSWDESTGRVTSLACTMDLLTPLLRVLGNLEDVSYVLEHALMTPEYLIGEMPGEIR